MTVNKKWPIFQVLRLKTENSCTPLPHPAPASEASVVLEKLHQGGHSDPPVNHLFGGSHGQQ
jgi:hypothetical protein